jgi:cell division protein FtsB
LRRIGIVLVVVLSAAIWAVADPESGVRAWIALDRERAAAEGRLEALRKEVSALEAEADALEGDPLAIEMAIRTDLGLVQPGETIVRVVREEPRPGDGG